MRILLAVCFLLLRLRRSSEVFRGRDLVCYRPGVAKDSVDKTQEEILEEMAKALGHSGNQLESVLNQLKELEVFMNQARSIEEYNSLVDKFNELHKLALIRREMLVIHREAVKVFKHSFIDVFYPIPGKKRKKSRL